MTVERNNKHLCRLRFPFSFHTQEFIKEIPYEDYPEDFRTGGIATPRVSKRSRKLLQSQHMHEREPRAPGLQKKEVGFHASLCPCVCVCWLLEMCLSGFIHVSEILQAQDKDISDHFLDTVRQGVRQELHRESVSSQHKVLYIDVFEMESKRVCCIRSLTLFI